MADIKKLVQRSDKVAFMKVSDKWHRMKGFTSLSMKKNAKEYSRQYVDELFETTDVVSISVSTDFAFDQYKGDKVHDHLVEMIDNEKIGTDATVEILVVDFTKPTAAGGATNDEFHAKKRSYSVIPSSEGDSLDAYTYSGAFKVKGAAEDVKVKSTDGWQTVTISA